MDPNFIPNNIELSSIDVTTLHYVYSTIAQTLAGAFGVLGAFMLFHIQSVNQSIKGICTRINEAGRMKESTNLQGVAHDIELYLAQENWDDFMKTIDKVGLHEIGWSYVIMEEFQFESLKDLLRKQLNIKRIIINKFTFITLPLTAITISLSLIFLAIAPSIVNHFFYSKSALLFSISLTIICIGMYADLVRNVFKGYKLSSETKEENNRHKKEIERE